MLIRANLLRMRGHWDAAADQCAEVLRVDPANATGHSLLGDIYQDQGRMEQARHWFQLALELNPSSEADRAKLARAEEMLEARSQKAEWEAVIEGRSHPVATTLVVRETLQRAGALVGVGLCAIVLVMAMLMSAAERNRSTVDPGQPLFTFPRTKPAPIVMDTARERDLLKRVSAAPLFGLAQAVRITVDPRTNSGNLRVFVPRKLRESLTTPEYRVALLREAYYFARVLHLEDGSLKQIEVAVVGPVYSPDGSSETSLLLLGTLAAEDLVVEADALTPAELNKFYAEVTPPLWAPELTTPQ